MYKNKVSDDPTASITIKQTRDITVGEIRNLYNEIVEGFDSMRNEIVKDGFKDIGEICFNFHTNRWEAHHYESGWSSHEHKSKDNAIGFVRNMHMDWLESEDYDTLQ